MLLDRETEEEVEVDVVISGSAGGTPVIVSVECTATGRPSEIGWVNEMLTKHRTLPTNALILASKNGFTKTARKRAEANGVGCIELDHVDETDFSGLLGPTGSLWTKNLVMHAEKVWLLVRTARDEVLSVVVNPDHQIFDQDRAEVGTAIELVNSILESEPVGKQLLSEGAVDHTDFVVELPTKEVFAMPLHLHKTDTDELQVIEFVRIKGKCQFVMNDLGLKKGKLGPTQVAWGESDVLGRKAMFVASEDGPASLKLSMKFDEIPKKKPSRAKRTRA